MIKIKKTLINNRLTYLLLALIITAFSCSENNPIATPDDSIADCTTFTKLLCIGDSRVEGFHPIHESYRYPLWKLFIDNNNCVDFIGSRLDVFAPYDNYKGETFDLDHLAQGGAYTSDILLMLQEEATGLQPDIVLLGIGGNDLNDMVNTVDQTVLNIELIINSVRNLNPNTVVLVEQIAPARSDLMTPSRQDTLDMFNAKIANLANLRTTVSSPVITINMGSGWNDGYMADQLHYNVVGSELIANRYYGVLKDYLR